MIDALNIDVNDRSIQTVEVRGPGHEITIIEIRQGPAGADGSGGSSAITTSTSTNLTGFIRGNGTTVSGATAATSAATPNTLVLRDEFGDVTAESLRAYSSVSAGDNVNGIILSYAGMTFLVNDAQALLRSTATQGRTYTLPDATGTVLLDTTLASTLAEAPLPIASGGTGGNTASAARINLRVPASDATGIAGASAINNIVSITPNNYANMTVRDPNTIYIVTEL